MQPDSSAWQLRLLCLLATAIVLSAQPVARVHDGDTFELADGRKVRLDCVDAPELGQAGGRESRAFLEKLIARREVRIDRKGTDRYGRTLAEVTVDGIHVNLRSVEAGHAWRYVEYCRDPRYAAAEKQARAARAGLWAAPDPLAPWEFRKRQPPAAKDAAGGRKLIRGAKGGCYYVTASGARRYVERSACQ